MQKGAYLKEHLAKKNPTWVPAKVNLPAEGSDAYKALVKTLTLEAIAAMHTGTELDFGDRGTISLFNDGKISSPIAPASVLEDLSCCAEKLLNPSKWVIGENSAPQLFPPTASEVLESLSYTLANSTKIALRKTDDSGQVKSLEEPEVSRGYVNRCAYKLSEHGAKAMIAAAEKIMARNQEKSANHR